MYYTNYRNHNQFIVRGGEKTSMDFTNRSSQPQSFQPGSAASPAAPDQQPSHSKKDKKDYNAEQPKWYRLVTTCLPIVVILLIVSLTALIVTSRPETQAKFVDTSKLQAVFLNTGQVYFGNIASVNDEYFVLDNIYYLQTANTDTAAEKDTADSNNISLVKLGCELHQPYDRMVVNRDQVTFWENLKKDGQVAKAVKAFNDKNPNGQTCSAATAPATTNVQGGATTPTTTTNPTTNKKP
jgi:hypothetical protein